MANKNSEYQERPIPVYATIAENLKALDENLKKMGTKQVDKEVKPDETK